MTETATASKPDRRALGRAVSAVLSLLAVAGWLAVGAPGVRAASDCGSAPWCNSHLAPAARATMVLAAMTPAEKLSLVANGSTEINQRLREGHATEFTLAELNAMKSSTSKYDPGDPYFRLDIYRGQIKLPRAESYLPLSDGWATSTGSSAASSGFCWRLWARAA